MKRRMIGSMLVTALIVALASPAAMAASGSGTAGVAVTASVNARVDYRVVDRTHVDVRSNAPWRMSVVTADGAVEFRGEKTPTWRTIELPEDAGPVSVTLEP